MTDDSLLYQCKAGAPLENPLIVQGNKISFLAANELHIDSVELAGKGKIYLLY